MFNLKNAPLFSLVLASVAPLAPAYGQILGSIIPTIPNFSGDVIPKNSAPVRTAQQIANRTSSASNPKSTAASQIVKLQIDAIEKLLSPLEVFQRNKINPEVLSQHGSSAQYLHPIAGCYNNEDFFIQDLRLSPVVSFGVDAKDFPKFALHGTVNGKPFSSWAQLSINIDRQSLTIRANAEGHQISLNIGNTHAANPIDRVNMGGIATDVNGKRITAEEFPDYLDRAETGYDWTERRKGTLTVGIQKLDMTCSYLKSAELVIGTVAQAKVPKIKKAPAKQKATGTELPTFEVFADAKDPVDKDVTVTLFPSDPKSKDRRELLLSQIADQKMVDEILRSMEERDLKKLKRLGDDVFSSKVEPRSKAEPFSKVRRRITHMAEESISPANAIDPTLILRHTERQIEMIQALNDLSSEDLAQTFISSVARLTDLLRRVETRQELTAVMHSREAAVVSTISGTPMLAKKAAAHADIDAGVRHVRMASWHARALLNSRQKQLDVPELEQKAIQVPDASRW